MKLTDKVAAAASEKDTVQEAAESLKKGLSPEEAQQLWGKYPTFLRHNPEANEEYKKMDKKSKGWLAAANPNSLQCKRV